MTIHSVIVYIYDLVNRVNYIRHQQDTNTTVHYGNTETFDIFFLVLCS